MERGGGNIDDKRCTLTGVFGNNVILCPYVLTDGNCKINSPAGKKLMAGSWGKISFFVENAVIGEMGLVLGSFQLSVEDVCSAIEEFSILFACKTNHGANALGVRDDFLQGFKVIFNEFLSQPKVFRRVSGNCHFRKDDYICMLFLRFGNIGDNLLRIS